MQSQRSRVHLAWAVHLRRMEQKPANTSYRKMLLSRIPSVLLREHLKENLPQWTLLQWASVASMVMLPQMLAKLFARMLPYAETDYEKSLLQAAIQDISDVGHVGKHAESVFDAAHPGDKPPFFPFLERCSLPILLKKGDLVKTHQGSKTDAFLIWSTPEILPACSDLTDECYYCYSLDCGVPDDLFYIHEHVHICVADSCSESELSVEQKVVLSAIRQKLKD